VAVISLASFHPILCEMNTHEQDECHALLNSNFYNAYKLHIQVSAMLHLSGTIVATTIEAIHTAILAIP